MSYFNDWAVRFIYDEAADPLAAMLAKPFGEAGEVMTQESDLDRFKREFLEAVAGVEPSKFENPGRTVHAVYTKVFAAFPTARVHIPMEAGWMGHDSQVDLWNVAIREEVRASYTLGRELRAEAERRWAEKQCTVLRDFKDIQSHAFTKSQAATVDRVIQYGEQMYNEIKLAAMLAKPFGEADQDINGYTLVGSQRKVRKVVTIDQSVRTAYIKARLKERATAKRNEFGCQPNYTETDEF